MNRTGGLAVRDILTFVAWSVCYLVVVLGVFYAIKSVAPAEFLRPGAYAKRSILLFKAANLFLFFLLVPYWFGSSEAATPVLSFLKISLLLVYDEVLTLILWTGPGKFSLATLHTLFALEVALVTMLILVCLAFRITRISDHVGQLAGHLLGVILFGALFAVDPIVRLAGTGLRGTVSRLAAALNPLVALSDSVSLDWLAEPFTKGLSEAAQYVSKPIEWYEVCVWYLAIGWAALLCSALARLIFGGRART